MCHSLQLHDFHVCVRPDHVNQHNFKSFEKVILYKLFYKNNSDGQFLNQYIIALYIQDFQCGLRLWALLYI